MKNISIRQSVSSDIPYMCSMLEALFSIETDFTIDMEKQAAGLNLFLNRKDKAIFIADTGTPSGMITGQLLVSTASGGYSLLVEDLFVMPGFRKQGIASMLVRRLTDWAKGQGAVRAQLVADTENAPATAFYSKLGFSQSRMAGFYKAIKA